MSRVVIVLLSLLLMPASQAESDTNSITLFSQNYCAACEVAKRYLDARAVPYREYNISDSPLAHRYFDKLGGRGTPFFIVNNKRMQGFDSQRFWSLYGLPEADGPAVEAMAVTPPPDGP
ncbi:glutaredoxin family protein [Allohahella marinimesophila]|uniref:Glutaredoxin domain-containing protein n=1 Tax=Allohahella marinimesophila TaxID=1054972 RepID=A0ABP7PJ01_9GAMM